MQEEHRVLGILLNVVRKMLSKILLFGMNSICDSRAPRLACINFENKLSSVYF